VTLRLPSGVGVLPSQLLREAVDAGWIGGDGVAAAAIQPASLDLRLGDRFYPLRCSFLPGEHTVEQRMEPLIFDELKLDESGAVLERGRPYLIPLAETLDLPPDVKGKANPKSSTGRVDVFTRVITDYSDRFDEIQPGYRGQLYLEVVPLSFAVRVRKGLTLNQLRLSIGDCAVTGAELRDIQRSDPLLYRGSTAVAPEDSLVTDDGVFLSLDLEGDKRRGVGYRAKPTAPHLVMADVGRHHAGDYWELVRSERDRVVLEPERFYLLLSEESVRVPPYLAAEMTAFDPTSGELRTHYAGFFDPGFGYSADGALRGSRAALEVRAHGVPFMIEHGQRVCTLTFERMLAEPDKLYGEDIQSNYQGQLSTLSKHFKREPVAAASVDDDQLDLFGDRSFEA
jgi:dCTP deaminase